MLVHATMSAHVFDRNWLAWIKTAQELELRKWLENQAPVPPQHARDIHHWRYVAVERELARRTRGKKQKHRPSPPVTPNRGGHRSYWRKYYASLFRETGSLYGNWSNELDDYPASLHTVRAASDIGITTEGNQHGLLLEDVASATD